MSAETYEPGAAGFDNKYLEKGSPAEQHAPPADSRYHFDQSDLDRVQRRLKQRHVQMFVSAFFSYTAFIRVDRIADLFTGSP
jgi:hypothetical protein